MRRPAHPAVPVASLRQDECELPWEGMPHRAVGALYTTAVVEVVLARRGLGMLSAGKLAPGRLWAANELDPSVQERWRWLRS